MRQIIHVGIPRFDPRSLTAGFWYDAADTATITESSGSVSQWDDKSGNGRHLTQGTGSAQPTTGTRTQNNRNVLDFDGSSDYMTTGGSFTYGSGWTVFAVVLNDDGADGTAQIILIGNNATAYGRLAKTTTDTWRINSGALLDRGTPDTSAHVLVSQFNTTSSLVRIDGAQVGATGNAGSNSASVGFRIGATDGAASFWDGWIAEIIGYPSVLSAGDIALVEAYLNLKWAVYSW